MLRIPQRAVSNAARRQISTLTQRNVARNVKTSLSLIAATTIKRQQPWKMVSLYMGSKRYYAGKKKKKKIACIIISN